ncbi:MAG: bifunctional nuclease family protein [Candidatus Marinimicrobia bacterium]|nr:bifunctional nuclease family protein [Candidatus Neomarinimicrobiota bacterium]MCH8836861.1 bifunctional nuclease family protein [Candidatus Neomarinimicrobiota bacterium]
MSADMIQVQVEKISFYPPSKGYAVLLKESLGSRYLPVIVGSFEAQSIALALEEVQMPRPMTHDLFCNILEELNIEIREVLISSLTDGTFFSKISLAGESGSGEVDSRPSDAIALALRVGAPIYVTEAVMEEASVQELTESTVSPSDNPAEEVSPQQSQDYLKQLEEQLARAVLDEEYEAAAVIRDKIKKIHAEISKQ